MNQIIRPGKMRQERQGLETIVYAPHWQEEPDPPAPPPVAGPAFLALTPMAADPRDIDRTASGLTALGTPYPLADYMSKTFALSGGGSSDGVFNVLDYNVDVDDATAGFQRTIDAALVQVAATGAPAVVLIPPGMYDFDSAIPVNPGQGDLIFMGYGAVLRYNEGTSSAKQNIFKNIAYSTTKGSLRFVGVEFQGTLTDDNVDALGGPPIWVNWYPSISIEFCTFTNIRSQAMETAWHQRGVCIGCNFNNIGAGTIKFNDCHDVEIVGNTLWRIGDDPIAVGVASNQVGQWPDSPIHERIVIANNTVRVSSGSIKVSGAKSVSITGNTIDLCAGGISIIYDDISTGKVPQHDILIANNIITNSLGIDGSGVISPPFAHIVVQAMTARGGPATNNVVPMQYDSVSGTIIKPWNWNQSKGADATTPIPPTAGVRISGNILRRTKPAAVAFSDYDYGKAIHQGISYDSAVEETDLRAQNGIWISAIGLNEVSVTDNIIEHTLIAVTFIPMTGVNDGRNIAVRGNQCHDFANQGIILQNNTSGGMINAIVENNILDGDYYRVNSNSNIDGSYDANGAPHGVFTSLATGLVIRNNYFKNVCQPVQTSSSLDNLYLSRNILYCSTPAALGFNTGNKGIGTIPSAGFRGQWHFVLANSDPTSGTFGALTSIPVREAAAMPTTGWYPAGWMVDNTAASVIDASNMSIIGWRRITTGTAHVSGTDWAILRASHVSPAT